MSRLLPTTYKVGMWSRETVALANNYLLTFFISIPKSAVTSFKNCKLLDWCNTF